MANKEQTHTGPGKGSLYKSVWVGSLFFQHMHSLLVTLMVMKPSFCSTTDLCRTDFHSTALGCKPLFPCLYSCTPPMASEVINIKSVCLLVQRFLYTWEHMQNVFEFVSMHYFPVGKNHRFYPILINLTKIKKDWSDPVLLVHRGRTHRFQLMQWVPSADSRQRQATATPQKPHNCWRTGCSWVLCEGPLKNLKREEGSKRKET